MSPEESADVLTAIFLFGLDAFRLVLVGFLVWLMIPRRKQCPQCGEPTEHLQGPRALKWVLLERRWCLACGWTGVARRERAAETSTPTPPTIPISSIVLGVVLLSAACGREEDELAAVLGNPANWVDLSHPFDEQTIYWPTSEPFKIKRVADGVTAGGYYYSASNFSAAEHGGTHLDAPVHFAQGRHTTDQIPLSQFVGPAAVVDVSTQAAANPDYRVTGQELGAFESAHGPIAQGTIVLFRTGWGARWPDRKAYLGTDATGPAAVPKLHFPGIDTTAARWLTLRKVDAVGIDTPSIDYGQSTTFDVHRILFAADIPAFENVAHLDRLPATGAFVIALPMKITNGTGGPLRIVAVLPPKPE